MGWLEDTIAGLESGACDIDVVFPSVSRRVGRGPLGAPADTRFADTTLAAWHVDDAARTLLLLAYEHAHPSGGLAKANQLYFAGDTRERAGALRAMVVLGDSKDGLPAILDAMRVNQGGLYEAAVCDNPYSSKHLPDLEFRKAVLKAIFIGLSVTRIIALTERADAELCASVLDYITEREAASRSVPAELWPILALHPPPGVVAKLIGYLEHPNPDHRIAAASALHKLSQNDSRIGGFLTDRIAREPVANVKRAMTQAVN